MYIYIHIYMYLYMYVFICMCVYTHLSTHANRCVVEFVHLHARVLMPYVQVTPAICICGRMHLCVCVCAVQRVEPDDKLTEHRPL